jgi:acyl-CoA thioesterase FadM
MRTHCTDLRVEAAHIDAGDHANWLAQLRIAQDAHFALRDEVGLGLDFLKSRHGLFLVMGRIHDVTFHRQLRLHDRVEVRLKMWRSRATCFELSAELLHDGHSASTMSWTMPLVSMTTGRLCRIPQWMVDIVGDERPVVPTVEDETLHIPLVAVSPGAADRAFAEPLAAQG